MSVEHLFSTGNHDLSTPAHPLPFKLLLFPVLDQHLTVIDHTRHKLNVADLFVFLFLRPKLLVLAIVVGHLKMLVRDKGVGLEVADCGRVRDARIGVGRLVPHLRLLVSDLEVLAVAELGEHFLVAGCAQLQVLVVDAEQRE